MLCKGKPKLRAFYRLADVEMLLEAPLRGASIIEAW
jgi:hypothetical protein